MISEYYRNPDIVLDYGHSRVDRQFTMEFHMHDVFEIYYFISGDVNYFIENKVYKLKYGDLLVMNSNELHKASLQSDARYERITVHFMPELVRELSPSGFDLLECFTARKKGERNKIHLSKDTMRDVEELFKRMESLDRAAHHTGEHGAIHGAADVATGGSSGSSGGDGNDVLKLACFIELLVFINRAFKNTPADADPGEHDVPQRLEPVFRYIDENLDGDLSLATLAAKSYTDRFYLSRLFKSSTGMSLQDYILYKKIFRAKELLSQGLNVMEACQTSGFNDYSNFIRTFKKLTGVPPGRYGRRFKH